MVDQVLADAGQVDEAGDAVRPELVGRADAGQHQQLRGDQRARGDDHLAVGEGLPLRALRVAVGDADGPAVLDRRSGATGAFRRRVRFGLPSSGAMKA